MYYAKAAGRFATSIAMILAIAGCDRNGIDTGIPAPALSVTEWIQGGPYDVTDTSHIYVVEFWASWCPYCRDAIPAMSALQDDFAGYGVIVLGVTTEDSATVHAFLESQAGALRYTVAIDDHSASTTAYGVSSIPIVFVIDTTGAIVWKGHPSSEDLRKKLKDLCGL